MSNTPTQSRSIDPFSSYASDITNTLSRGVTRNNDGILAVSDFTGYVDSTGIVVIRPGFAYMSDLLIQVTANHSIDFTDSNNYVNPNGSVNIFDTAGYYYIVMEYQFQKSRPAPVARIKIIRPTSQDVDVPDDAVARATIGTVGTKFLFLHAAKVENLPGGHQVVSLHDADPTNTTYTRKYVDLDISAIYEKPTHSPTRDRGRVLYEASVNKYWFGYEDRWEEISAGASITIDTTSNNVVAGMAAYIDSAGVARPASMSSGTVETRAEMIVLEVGTSATGNGRGRIAGVVDSVLVESSAIINIGDVVYLSATEDGKVTNVRPSGIYQVLGKCITGGSGSGVINTPISMLFVPGDIIFTAIAGTIEVGDWSGAGPYTYNIDISRLNLQQRSVLIDTWSAGVLTPVTQVDLAADGTTVTITNNTNIEIDYILTDGAGGGASSGGGGATSHALLSNLSYASSGHTGFAPSPHGNADHSSTFITSASVTYGTLAANGDVGTSAGQLAIGNHTHSTLSDIPTGSRILFESNVAISGYTLLTTVDDSVVYITKGSAVGGETGGSYKAYGTWTQPTHTLTTAEMPAHTHVLNNHLVAAAALYAGSNVWQFNALTAGYVTASAGSSGSHRHDQTWPNGNTWRPYGLNFTRQQRT